MSIKMSIYNNRVFGKVHGIKLDEIKGVFMGRYTKGKNPLLSISLLVSNSIDTIRKCMESIKPLLEALPSELIVVDGGSKDGAIDIAREYADEIVPFVWCDDFSAARNAGLKKTSGEWFLYLDDDEWFEDVTEILNFFQSGEYKKYEYGWYIQRNYIHVKDNYYTEAYVGRMHKRIPGLCFQGRIHEGFFPASSQVKTFSTYVHHYGYLADLPEQKKKKSERNITLVELEYKKNPKNLRMAAQLVQEYIIDKQFEKAENLMQKLLQENKNNIRHPFMQYIIVGLVRLEESRDDWEKAEEKLHWIEGTYSLEEASRLVCAVEHIVIADKRRDFKHVLEAFPKYVSVCTQVREGGRDIQKKFVLDLYSYSSQNIEQQMVKATMRAMLQTEDFSLAELVFSKIKWAEEERYAEPYGMTLLRVYEKDKEAEAFFSSIASALDNPSMHDMLMNELEERLLQDSKRRKIFLEKAEVWQRTEPFFQLLNIERYLRKCKVTYVHNECSKNRKESVIQENMVLPEDAMQAYFGGSCRKYDAFAVVLLLKEPAWVNKLFEWVDFTTFQQGVAIYLESDELECIWKNIEALENVWPETRRLYYDYMRMQFLEKALLEEKIPVEALWDYVEATLAFMEAYFGEATFAENGKGLPRNGQFAIWMKQAALCKNAGDRVGWSERVKAAELYPVIIPVIQNLLQEETKPKKPVAVSAEMLALATELKKQVRSLIAV